MYGRKWVEASAAWLQEYPICTLCLVYGSINDGATEFALARQRNLVVDHIEPHQGDANLFWDQDNWQTLCRFPCHDKDKQRHEKAGKTGIQWLEMLEHVMRERGTDSLVKDMAEHLPEHIRKRLLSEANYGR